ncbi:AraC family transcriptional regulator [Adhaeribacter aerolatus]|uniref:AraC family transcriptional regulator n=1 Tax=Adhaeribacter aerolatus TaxID=670289 RepID=A0A512AVN6_9BACT|nr:helix-turn-helix transcriptional regulator [Adhaeribacter aerolatus]GEO03779.1 AraC family transcriptional regulator [Adhaeribacter aerolatus]
MQEKLTEEESSKEIIVLELTAEREVLAQHRQHYFTHILCHSGKARFRMDNQLYQIKPNDIVISLPAIEIKDLEYSRNFKATCLFVSFDLMSKNNPDIGWGIRGYLFSKENPVVHLSDVDAQKCRFNFQLLQEKQDDKAHRFQEELVNLQLQMFIMEMWNIFAKEIDKRSITDQKGALFERFLQLVQEHCMEEREVDFYADKLCITPKYLTEVCKKSSAKTASEWIQNYTTQRLIILLQNKQLSFTDIADTLHFSSLSFFSHYVKKVLGVSPSEYRLRMANL